MPKYYDLDSANKFVCAASVGTTIIVYELNTQNPRNATMSDFNVIATIGDVVWLNRSSFDALKIRDFRIEGTKLRALAEDLLNANVMVNNEGFGYFRKHGSVATSVSQRIEFYRLNDLFDWPSHGVLLPQDLETKWDRCVFGRREAKINYPVMENELKDLRTRKKGKEAKLKAKEKEIGDAKDELKAIENELINTNTKIGIKDKEIRDKQTEIDMLIAKLKRMQQAIEEIDC